MPEVSSNVRARARPKRCRGKAGTPAGAGREGEGTYELCIMKGGGEGRAKPRSRGPRGRAAKRRIKSRQEQQNFSRGAGPERGQSRRGNAKHRHSFLVCSCLFLAPLRVKPFTFLVPLGRTSGKGKGRGFSHAEPGQRGARVGGETQSTGIHFWSAPAFLWPRSA